MGIEPTKLTLARSFTGFEDRGRHQIDARFRTQVHTGFGERQGERCRVPGDPVVTTRIAWQVRWRSNDLNFFGTLGAIVATTACAAQNQPVSLTDDSGYASDGKEDGSWPTLSNGPITYKDFVTALLRLTTMTKSKSYLFLGDNAGVQCSMALLFTPEASRRPTSTWRRARTTTTEWRVCRS